MICRIISVLLNCFKKPYPIIECLYLCFAGQGSRSSCLRFCQWSFCNGSMGRGAQVWRQGLCLVKLILKGYNTVPHIQCTLLAKKLSNDVYFEKKSYWKYNPPIIFLVIQKCNGVNSMDWKFFLVRCKTLKYIFRRCLFV